jgi:hypothetical protein
MSLFKKKEPPAVIDCRCPVEGCDFTATDQINLKKHIDWKHPEISLSDEKVAEKVQ